MRILNSFGWEPAYSLQVLEMVKMMFDNGINPRTEDVKNAVPQYTMYNCLCSFCSNIKIKQGSDEDYQVYIIIKDSRIRNFYNTLNEYSTHFRLSESEKNTIINSNGFYYLTINGVQYTFRQNKKTNITDTLFIVLYLEYFDECTALLNGIVELFKHFTQKTTEMQEKLNNVKLKERCYENAS